MLIKLSLSNAGLEYSRSKRLEYSRTNIVFEQRRLRNSFIFGMLYYEVKSDGYSCPCSSKFVHVRSEEHYVNKIGAVIGHSENKNVMLRCLKARLRLSY